MPKSASVLRRCRIVLHRLRTVSHHFRVFKFLGLAISSIFCSVSFIAWRRSPSDHKHCTPFRAPHPCQPPFLPSPSPSSPSPAENSPLKFHGGYKGHSWFPRMGGSKYEGHSWFPHSGEWGNQNMKGILGSPRRGNQNMKETYTVFIALLVSSNARHLISKGEKKTKISYQQNRAKGFHI